jgi:hypothetical protein
MKAIFTTALLCFGIVAFAQTPTTTTATKSSATTTTATQQAPVLTAKAKSLCKEWVLTKTEVFSDPHDPTDAQKNDKLILMENGRYRLIYSGVAEGGTWSIDKANTWITLTTDDGKVKKFKVLESTDKTLKVDYKDAEEIHNVLYYAPAGTTTTTTK